MNYNRKRSTINSITKSDGCTFTHPDHIEAVSVNQFKNTLATTNLRPSSEADLTHTNVTGCLSNEDAVNHSQLVDDLEIENVNRWTNMHKSPGPDGFSFQCPLL